MTRMMVATRNYVIRLGVGLAGYAVLLVGAIWVLNRFSDQWWRFIVAALPAVPLVLVARAVARYLGEVDELQSRIQLEALAFAFGAGSLLTFTYGLLQLAGLPPVSWMFVWPVYAGSWVFGLILARRRY